MGADSFEGGRADSELQKRNLFKVNRGKNLKQQRGKKERGKKGSEMASCLLGKALIAAVRKRGGGQWIRRQRGRPWTLNLEEGRVENKGRLACLVRKLAALLGG